MKLSTELMLTNLVILGALWYCALNDMLPATFALLGVMFWLRFLSISAARKEREIEMEKLRLKIREWRERNEQ